MAKGHDPGRRVHLGSGTRQAAHHHPRGEPGWGRRSSSIRAKTDPEEREPAPHPGTHPLGPQVGGHLSSQTPYPKGRHLGGGHRALLGAWASEEDMPEAQLPDGRA